MAPIASSYLNNLNNAALRCENKIDLTQNILEPEFNDRPDARFILCNDDGNVFQSVYCHVEKQNLFMERIERPENSRFVILTIIDANTKEMLVIASDERNETMDCYSITPTVYDRFNERYHLTLSA